MFAKLNSLWVSNLFNLLIPMFIPLHREHNSMMVPLAFMTLSLHKSELLSWRLRWSPRQHATSTCFMLLPSTFKHVSSLELILSNSRFSAEKVNRFSY